MSFEAFAKHTYDLLESIDDCAEKARLLPCLTLLYSGMDVMASLNARPGESVQAGFVRWVDHFMLPAHNLDCTSIDLKHLDHMETDREAKSRFDAASGLWFTTVSREKMGEFLASLPPEV